MKKHVDNDDHDRFALSVPYSYPRPHRHSYRDSNIPGCPILGRHGSVSLCRVERENKMAATYNVLAFKR